MTKRIGLTASAAALALSACANTTYTVNGLTVAGDEPDPMISALSAKSDDMSEWQILWPTILATGLVLAYVISDGGPSSGDTLEEEGTVQ